MNNHRIAIALASVLLAGTAACTKEEPYQTVLPMKEVMGHVIDPAAWAMWNTTGWIDDASGTRNRLPTTEEGWLAAETGAATVAEAANLLMLPGRREDDGDWLKFAKMMHDNALEARQAVIDRDEQAMFDTGGKMYEACTGCHAIYLLPKLPEEEREATYAPLPDLPLKDYRAAVAEKDKAAGRVAEQPK